MNKTHRNKQDKIQDSELTFYATFIINTTQENVTHYNKSHKQQQNNTIRHNDTSVFSKIQDPP